MNNEKFEIPVVLFAFNRIDTLKKVFEEIKKAEPAKFYFVMDAARETAVGEKEKVAAIREYIESNVTWNCEFMKNYAEHNMGCGRRVSSGISWVFENEDRAIILEDDCLPSNSFFEYCKDMLGYYEQDDRIYAINGSNFFGEAELIEEAYSFTQYPFVWGWATWRRCWEKYDFDMRTWKAEKREFKKMLSLRSYIHNYTEMHTAYHHGIDTWDYQWLYTVLSNKGLCVVPQKNMIQNIGFNDEATHTSGEEINIERFEIEFPIKHYEGVARNLAYDYLYEKKYYKNNLTLLFKILLGLDPNKSLMSIVKGK